MARDSENIEREIEQARNELAQSLDALAVRANPQRLAADAQASVMATLNKPVVRYSLVGVGVVVIAVIIKKVVS
ncbi:DUF3618 domain-containing protein [Jongsikchunia kroppenstedtii]|uniref:DUF3618 domain-containing protein n=1 Tax=Jongsikchunia kroppenstedtii TaxID=1121721 RepID=UPI00039BE886|nr:DUF3618 domain-containing protein [Jongsikchunia kroppenstedtii]